MFNRSKEYYRQVREEAITRKQRISNSYWHVKAPGMLSEGKIHCSCWMCTEKSNVRGCPVSERRRYITLQEELRLTS